MLPSRKPAIVTGLLYPSFLGALVYEAIPKLFYGEPKRLPLETIALIAALLWHYVLDYIYTYDRDKDAPYDWVMFITDALMVLCLFLAIRQSYAGSALQAADARIWLFMLGAKLAAFVWELAEARYSGFDRNKTRALLTDWVFCWPYMLGMFFSPDQPLLLAGVLVADAGAYLLHQHYVRRALRGNP